MATTKYEIKNKVTYNNGVKYVFDFEDAQLLPEVKIGQSAKKGDIITKRKNNGQIQEIPNDGNESFKVGDTVKKDQVISKTGKLIKKKHKCKFDGVILEVAEKLITIQESEALLTNLDQKPLQPEIPFDSVLEKELENSMIISFPAVEINLFNSKGESRLGKLKYMNSSELRDKENDSELPDLHRKILVTDTISSNLYPLLSTLGVIGIIVNHIDYNLYNELILLDVPIAIISGFGELKEDGTIIKYLEGKNGENVWLDTDFDRLILPESESPKWLDTYSYDLAKIKIV